MAIIIETELRNLGINIEHHNNGLDVHSPATGDKFASIGIDGNHVVQTKISAARDTNFASDYEVREKFLLKLADKLEERKELLAALITKEAGKTAKGAAAEVDRAIGIFRDTVKNAKVADTADGAKRSIVGKPLGVIGLITSFNFPLTVACWTIAPALLAGNKVVWKPSEKTPLSALVFKALFDECHREFNADNSTPINPDIIQIAIGGREVGQELVRNDSVAKISATGSVGMCESIKSVLATKRGNLSDPILEGGGNNGVIISGTCNEHIDYVVDCLLKSFLIAGGQQCTNTRRVFIHEGIYDAVIEAFKTKLQNFIDDGCIMNPEDGEKGEYFYAPLIDKDGFDRFEAAKKQLQAEGGKLSFGERVLHNTYPNAFYVQPAIAEMPTQTSVMIEETFAPLLFVTKYRNLQQAIDMMNAPENAGLVNGIYTRNAVEAEEFKRQNQAGHTVINSPIGTSRPMATGMGFGGQKKSGTGEILNTKDPLAPFMTKETTRVAEYPMSK